MITKNIKHIESEIVHSLVCNHINQPTFSFLNHFNKNECVFIDNINGKIDFCNMPMHRKSGIGNLHGTWCRARAIIYALLSELNLFPILAFIENRKDINGLGISDDLRYASILELKFNYQNTWFHKEPRLDIMKFKHERHETLDFIICSDVLEHTIGDYKIALKNFYYYLRKNGILVLTVPFDMNIEKTIEHYPSCINYTVVFDETNENYLKTIIHYHNSDSIAENPVFHGGPGNTLEMRKFSFQELVNETLKLGYSKYKFYPLDNSFYGISPTDKTEGCIVFIK